MKNRITNIQSADTINSDSSLGLYKRYDAASVTQWHKENKTNITGFIGVTYRRKRGVFEARIRVHGRKEKLYIGSAPTAQEAAVLYDTKARELYGSGAVLNFDISDHDEIHAESDRVQ